MTELRAPKKGERTMGIKKYLFVIAVVLLTVGSAMGEEVSRAAATLGDDGVQRVDVIGGSYFYKPNHIVVKVNIPVELKVSKESGFIPHDIVAKSPEAGMEFQENLSSTPNLLRPRSGHIPSIAAKRRLLPRVIAKRGWKGLLRWFPDIARSHESEQKRQLR
jgi:hypothetical protein